MNRGDVVTVRVPYLSGVGGKSRPAVVIQADFYNNQLVHTIIAAITSNLARAADPAYLLIDPATADGAPSGLHQPSLIRCDRLFTIDQKDVAKTIGKLSSATIQEVDACLKAVLNLP